MNSGCSFDYGNSTSGYGRSETIGYGSSSFPDYGISLGYGSSLSQIDAPSSVQQQEISSTLRNIAQQNDACKRLAMTAFEHRYGRQDTAKIKVYPRQPMLRRKSTLGGTRW